MGMFDHVRCDYPVPDARLQKATFQTKNLGCAMGHFTITIDGEAHQRAVTLGEGRSRPR